MADLGITVAGGTAKRLLTAGKYCDKNILVTATGGGGAPEPQRRGEVNFYDFDGTLLRSYTLAEAKTLSALPDGPVHDGLVFQGWSLSLAALAACTGPVDVGAVYITDDGKTRLFMEIPANAMEGKPPVFGDVKVNIGQTAAHGVTVDWGDGSAPETAGDVGAVSFTHTYARSGRFCIALDPAEGCELILGGLADPAQGGYPGVIGSAEELDINLLCGISVGKNVSGIGLGAFADALSLSSVTLPRSVTAIGISAFSGASSLECVVIPDSVTEIGPATFSDCTSLRLVILPERLTGIAENLFYGCDSLRRLTVPDGVKSVGARAFRNCGALSGLRLPPSVDSIGESAFQDCELLFWLELPEGLSELSANMCNYCYLLNAVTIPDSVTKIGEQALYQCVMLSSVTVPRGVTEIGAAAFWYSGLKEIHLLPEVPPALNEAFWEGSERQPPVIYVPRGSLEAYQTANYWSGVAEYIVEEM